MARGAHLPLLALLAVWAACCDGAGEGGYAVVTAVFGTGSKVVGHLFGAQALAGSLLAHEVVGDRVLMTTAEAWVSVSQDNPIVVEKIEKLWKILFVPPIACNPSDDMHAIYGSYSAMNKRHSETCTKLNVFGLDHYSKVLYLDADTLVRSDVGWVFAWPSEFAAAADPCLSYMLNTGVMLLTPSKALLAELKALNREEGSFDNGDQGVVNLRFAGRWYGSKPGGVPYATLPPFMNTPSSSVGTISARYAAVMGERLVGAKGLRRGAMQAPQVIHFMGGQHDEKPWAVAAFDAFSQKGQPHPTWGASWGPGHPSWGHHKDWQQAFAQSETLVSKMLQEAEGERLAGGGEGDDPFDGLLEGSGGFEAGTLEEREL